MSDSDTLQTPSPPDPREQHRRLCTCSTISDHPSQTNLTALCGPEPTPCSKPEPADQTRPGSGPQAAAPFWAEPQCLTLYWLLSSLLWLENPDFMTTITISSSARHLTPSCVLQTIYNVHLSGLQYAALTQEEPPHMTLSKKLKKMIYLTLCLQPPTKTMLDFSLHLLCFAVSSTC